MKLARRAAPHLAPLAVLLAALALAHGEIFRAGAAELAPVALEGADIAGRLAVSDVTFEAWLTARQARTLLSRPWRLFDTEHCAPEERSIVFSIPMIATGLYGMPAALFTREPVWIYNSALVVWSAVAALAMYSLVTAWTGRRAAGVATALLFAFHPLRLGNVLHPTEWDIAWTALALCFAERLFAAGRWRDAVGLGLAGAMQVVTSFYPLFAATLLALPLGLWLWLRRAPRRATLAQLALAVGLVALAAAVVLGPYLVARQADRIGGRTAFYFAAWGDHLPGGRYFLGWPLLACAAAGLRAPRRLGLARVAGDPRLALCCAVPLVAFVAAGPTTAESLQSLGLPVPAFDPYTALAQIVPGLDAVRAVARLTTALHLVACVLAGAGIAAAIGAAGRYGRAAACALVALAWLLGSSESLRGVVRWRLEEIRPSQASIDFASALGEPDSAGSILEVPLDFIGDDWYELGPQRMLLSAWHGRRTSACTGSYRSPNRNHLGEVSGALPGAWALHELWSLGFTTILIHHEDPLLHRLTRQSYARAIERGRGLRLLRESDSMIAYEILPEPAPESRPGQE